MKPLGTSLVAFGVARLLVGLMTVGGDFPGFLLIFIGIAVMRGSQRAVFWAMAFSSWCAIEAVAIIVAAIANELQDIGLWNVAFAAALGAWATSNLLILGQVWSRLAAATEPTGPPEESRLIRSKRPFQFSLRSLLVVIAIVALGCALGSRRLTPRQAWEHHWISSADGSRVHWSVGVIGNESGRPVAGYLWQRAGKSVLGNPTRVRILSRSHRSELRVDGVLVEPVEASFQLVVNDTQDNPMCLHISRAKANELFGHDRLDGTKLEEFWEETVEPARRPLSTTPAAHSVASHALPAMVRTPEEE